MGVALTVRYCKSTMRESLFGYALRVTVSDATDMPTEVFVFQRGAAPAPTAGAVTRDKFIAVTDPVGLEEVPAQAPDLGNEIPYYRLPEVTLFFRSPEELEETRKYIDSDLKTLVRSLNAMTTFDTTDIVTYS